MSTVNCDYELSYTVTFEDAAPGEVKRFAEELRRYRVNEYNVVVQGDVVVVKTHAHGAIRTRETVEATLSDLNYQRQNDFRFESAVHSSPVT